MRIIDRLLRFDFRRDCIHRGLGGGGLPAGIPLTGNSYGLGRGGRI